MATAGTPSATVTGSVMKADEEIVNRCVAADPRHGELWTNVSKSRHFRRASTAIVLRKVSEKILLDSSRDVNLGVQTTSTSTNDGTNNSIDMETEGMQ